MSTLLFALVMFSAVVTSEALTKKALVLSPITTSEKAKSRLLSNWLVEPGKVVNVISETPQKNLVTIEFEGKSFQDVGDFKIIPFDPTFTFSRVYLELVDKNGDPISERNFSDEDSASLKTRFCLAKNISKGFPSQPLAAEFHFLLCRYSEEFEGYQTEGKGGCPETEKFIKEHLKRFPHSKFKALR